MSAKTAQGDYGVAVYLRFAKWCAARPWILALQPKSAMYDICAEFGVSRATGYRWLAAWRDVNPMATRKAV